MNRAQREWRRAGVPAMILTVWLAGGLAAWAAVPAIITRAGSGQKIQGNVKWQPASKQYVVQDPNSPVELKLQPEEVENIRVKKPDQIDNAANLFRSGEYAKAIPVLQQIADDYAMLEWDVPAGAYLASSYLKLKEKAKAADACEKVLQSNAKAIADKAFATAYWDALLGTEQYAKLKTALTKAIEEGNRDTAAVAQLKRGDMEMAKGNFKDALIDGFLRTVVFFEAVKEVQPEALYKAAKCFEQIGQIPNADKMRKKLMADYADSEFAAKVKAGQ